jgi:hypothetical protein
MWKGFVQNGCDAMSYTPVICPVCHTRTGICLRDAEWYCCVCGVDYVDTDFEQVIE